MRILALGDYNRLASICNKRVKRLFIRSVIWVNPLSGQEPYRAPGIDKGLSRNILRVKY